MAEYKKLPDGTIVKVAGQGGIADNLTTLSSVMSLSANQGKLLNDNKANKADISSIITTGTKNTTGVQIASGTYFYLNGQLVKAKSNIAVNADYTLNTNYEVVTVGDVLSELNSKVTANTLGTPVELTPYSTSSKKYTIPDDGYVYIGGTGKGLIAIQDGFHNNDKLYIGTTVANSTIFDSLFVRKGMRVWVSELNGVSATYYPLS